MKDLSQLELQTLVDSIPQLAWFTDPSGYILWYNKQWYDYTGTTLETMRGWGWRSVHHPDFTERVTEKWMRHLEEGQAWEDTFPLKSKSGEFRWFLSRARPVKDEHGEVKFWFGTNTDITDQLTIEQELERNKEKTKLSELRYKHLIETLPQLVWTCKPSGEVDYLSPQWLAYTGVPPVEESQRNWLESVHPDDRERVATYWTGAVKGWHSYDIEYRLRRYDGVYRWFKARGTSVQSENGGVASWLGTSTDVDDQRKLIEALGRSQERLTMATSAADIGIWEWDIVTDSVTASEIARRMFDLPSKNSLSIDQFYERVLSEDQFKAHRRLTKALSSKTDYEAKFRIGRSDGSITWLYVRGRTLYSTDGRPLRMFGVSTDITGRMRVEENLKKSIKRATEANDLKSAFLANMSHEIRTPLGALLGFTDLLQDPAISQEERESYHRIVKRNGEQLSQLINDILDLSKVEAGQFQAEIVSTQIRSIIDEICLLLSIHAKEKGLEFIGYTEADVPQTIGTDPVRVRQILTNVVGNAIKFTNQGSVRIVAKRSEDASVVCFEISDTGIGIAAEDRNTLFQPFTQADPSITRRFGGTGLGLVLSRKFARALGGDLELVSSEIGKGSVFHVHIRNQLGTEEKQHKDSDPQEQKHSSSTAVNSAAPLSGLKVLVVDDSPDNQHLFSMILTRNGATIDVAENGLEAVVKATTGNFDIILMDIQMPKMDGYTATMTLREQKYSKPIIALTAHAMTEVRSKTLNVGCDDHLTKPIKTELLVQKVAQYGRRKFLNLGASTRSVKFS